MAIDLPFIWALILAFAVLAYVVLDGFDLGVGVLFPLLPDTSSRDIAMGSVAPVWDGNETWLVLGGGGLMAAFPLAYAVLMPALYPLVIAMLIGLVLRGVAFEFRWKTERAKFLWDAAFFGGSVIAGFAQGVMLGAIVQGVKVEGRAYAGGWLDWLSAFSVMTGVALVVGYALLGATWLIWRTEHDVQALAYRVATPLGLALLAMIGIVSLWTPLLNPEYLARWLSFPAIVLVAPVPILTLAAATWLIWSIRARREIGPFAATLALFVLCYAGLGISLYPHVVPPSITIWDAASPDVSLRFMLVGAVVLVPMILAYTAYSYWVFRGKVDPEAHYH